MEKIITIVESFFELTGINVNASKSDLLVISNEKEKNIIKQELKFAGSILKPAAKNDPIRYLGIWITAKGDKKYQRNLINKKVTTATNIIFSKKITEKQTRYLINHVIMPQIEY